MGSGRSYVRFLKRANDEDKQNKRVVYQLGESGDIFNSKGGQVAAFLVSAKDSIANAPLTPHHNQSYNFPGLTSRKCRVSVTLYRNRK